LLRHYPDGPGLGPILPKVPKPADHVPHDLASIWSKDSPEFGFGLNVCLQSSELPEAKFHFLSSRTDTLKGEQARRNRDGDAVAHKHV
jgi:hypothetical protein